MSAPVLETFASRLYASLAPLAGEDDANAWALAKFCAALGVMFQPIEDVSSDTAEGPGWSAVVDVDRAPDSWLPWLAQFVGVTVVPGSTPAEQRVRIKGTDGFSRGTPDALRAALAPTLTGSKTVYFRERDAGDAYRLEVVTVASQTPDAAASEAALRAQKPGGIVLAFRTTTGQDYEEIATQGTYADVRDLYPDYEAMLGGGLS